MQNLLDIVYISNDSNVPAYADTNELTIIITFTMHAIVQPFTRAEFMVNNYDKSALDYEEG